MVLCATTVAAQSKRRVAIELVLAKAKHYLAIEERFEALERWDRAGLMVRSRRHEVSDVTLVIRPRNFTYAVPDPRKLLALGAYNQSRPTFEGGRVVNGTKMTLRGYFTRAAKAAEDRKVYMETYNVAPPARKRDRLAPWILGGESERTDVNWGTGGYTAMGRVLGLGFFPLRGLAEGARAAVVAPLKAAAEALRVPVLPAVLGHLDAVLDRGLLKALPDVHPVFDLRYGRTAFYYNHAMRLTANTRRVFRTAWRTPADFVHVLQQHYYATILGHTYASFPTLSTAWPSHERLEAALLRAAIAESKQYLARLGPRAAARRQRRLTALNATRATTKTTPKDET